MKNLSNNIKFALYARVSRDDDFNEESRSIENQRKVLKEYLLNNDLLLIKEYIDDGVSGKNLNRPAFNELLKDFKNGLIDGLIVKDFSRIGRNLYEVGNFIELYAPENNLRIISLLDKYDSSINVDDDSIVLKSFVNDYYLKEFRKKSRQAIIKRSENQVLANRGLFGYNLIVTDKRRELVINEDEAKAIRYVFQEYLKGKMPLEIINYLNDNNYISPGISDYNKNNQNLYNRNQNLKWKTRNIFDIVHNLSYSGTYINCKRKHCIVRSNEIQIPHIVSKEVQNAAIELSKSRCSNPDEHLSHFIYNTVEGEYFRCRRDYMNYVKRDNLYRLNKAKINSKGMSFKPDEIKEIILSETKAVIKELRKNKDYIINKINGTYQDNKNKLSYINKEINNLESKKKIITNEYISGNISKIEFDNKKDEIKILLIEYNKEKIEIEDKISNRDNIKYEKYVNEILSYKNVDLALARIIFKRIDVSLNDKKEKVLNFIYNI